MTAIRDYPNDSLQFLEGDAPGTPASGRVRLYAKGDGHVYSMDDTGTETPLSGGGGGSSVVPVATPAISSGVLTLDFGGASSYAGVVTLTSNVTSLVLTNLPGSGKFAEYELHISQDGTGGRTFAIPSSHKALASSITAIGSSPNQVTVISASTVNNGTTWRYAMGISA